MNLVKMTSCCLQGLSRSFRLSNSSTTCNLQMHAVFYSHAYRGITRRNHHTDAYAQEEQIRYQQTEVFFMVVKDADSVMTCGAALTQMPKGEKHFAKRRETFFQYSTTQHWAFQSITLLPFPNQTRRITVCTQTVVIQRDTILQLS